LSEETGGEVKGQRAHRWETSRAKKQNRQAIIMSSNLNQSRKELIISSSRHKSHRDPYG